MNKIKLKTFVSLAEIISSLAIVVSLIYVANEYRRSETLTNRDVENIIYQRIMEMNRLKIENPDLIGILLRAQKDSRTLTDEEQIRYLAFEHIFYDSWESAWYYHHEGILEEENWNSWNNWFSAEIKNKSFFSWQGNRKNFNGAYLEYIDRIFSENKKQNAEPVK
jgi:hypothetical protein